MTQFNFDEIIDRTGHSSAKWGAVDGDCLPMWVADMDFRSPPAAINAMIERARHGVFGYTMDPPKLKEVVVERMSRLYNWQITPDDVLFSPGMVLALCATCSGFGAPGDTVLIQTPVYGSFFRPFAPIGNSLATSTWRSSPTAATASTMKMTTMNSK